MQPQAQLVYQSVHLNDTQDQYGRFALVCSRSSHTRLGVRLVQRHETQDAHSYELFGKVNLWHAFNTHSKTRVSSFDQSVSTLFDSALGGDVAQVGVGITGRVSKNVVVSGSLDYNHAIDNGHGKSVSARINLGMEF